MKTQFILSATVFVLLLAGCNLGATPVITQTAPPSTTPSPTLSCDEFVTVALNKANAVCDRLGRNQACYGNWLVTAEIQPNSGAVFQNVGDVADLFAFKRLTTAPLDVAAQAWGVAILKAQANLPDTLPGQNVTFLLFGDASLENITPQMQAVVLRTGFSATTCENAPESAVLVQSPEGTRASLKINGADVVLGSTAYLTARTNDKMTVATIEGEAIVTAFNTTQRVQPGSQVKIPLGTGDGLQVIGPPSAPEPYDVKVVSRAPVPLLERPVQVPPPAPAITIPTATATILAPTALCTPRTDWTFRYTVQAGDTLFRIARLHNVEPAELQRGNCLADPNVIQAGQQLRVPRQAVTETLAPTVTIPTSTPITTDPNLRADQTLVQSGSCTTIRWDVSTATQVFFEGQPAGNQNSWQVCPKVDTTYTLLVIYADGRQVPYSIRVQVALPVAPTETQEPVR